ncbi:MAG: efflux RND transporter periplasmic adaptor subunit [Elusimicrobiota bacterium]|jgi:macrolide-specific efflux system membrane fusion protein|nr:efflux RND transporter periplasmic adaptor subunit [Elusimicrobiota bacterium]
MKKKLIIIAGILIVVLVAVFFFMQKDSTTIESRASLQERNIIVEFRLTGEVIPRNRIEIKPPFAGRIENILVNEGDEVKKGQVLVLMSSNERASMIDAARAVSDKEYERWQTIYKETPISAPMNGFVILRDKEAGQTVGVSDAILAMADNLIIDASVDETDLKYIKIGQKLKARLDAYPDEQFDAVVEHIAYEATVVSNVTVYTIRIRPVSPPKNLRSGMTASIDVEIDNKENVPAIPSDFINTVGADHSVLVLADKKEKPQKQDKGADKRPPVQVIKTKNGDVMARKVEIGITDGKWTEIVSGLSKADTVVIVRAKKEAQQGAAPMGRGR